MKTYALSPLPKPVTATVAIPGSKSYTNRALLLAALTKQPVTLHNPLYSDDTLAMITCLRTLGIIIHEQRDTIEVVNDISSVTTGEYTLNATLSGTTIRFLLALATIIPGEKVITGNEGLRKRPVKDLVDALRQLGAEIEYTAHEGFPPLRVTSDSLNAGTVHINGAVSSQFLSSILMIAPCMGKSVTIEVEGKLISKPYVDMTLDTMKQFGVDVINNDYKSFTVSGSQMYKASDYYVEGDYSSASYFAAIAALTRSTITLSNLNPHSVQADKKFLDVLIRMGSKVSYGTHEITIQGGGVKPLEIDAVDFPDQAQTLAVLAAFAPGKTVITGVRSLRVKETDRVAAIEQELGKMGIKTAVTENSITVFGGNPIPATVYTYGDHRMAMSFAVAGSALDGMVINDPDVVAKTFPFFWKKLRSIGIDVKPAGTTNIVLIGLRGSGKTTVARIAAERLHKQYIELDDTIVKKAGMSIPEIVKKHGWDYFRDCESAAVDAIAIVENHIISPGGGVVTRARNIRALKKNGYCIWLRATAHSLRSRIEDDTNRPALTDKSGLDEMVELLNAREKMYTDAADEVIDTDTLSTEEVADLICSRYKAI